MAPVNRELIRRLLRLRSVQYSSRGIIRDSNSCLAGLSSVHPLHLEDPASNLNGHGSKSIHTFTTPMQNFFVSESQREESNSSVLHSLLLNGHEQSTHSIHRTGDAGKPCRTWAQSPMHGVSREAITSRQHQWTPSGRNPRTLLAQPHSISGNRQPCFHMSSPVPCRSLSFFPPLGSPVFDTAHCETARLSPTESPATLTTAPQPDIHPVATDATSAAADISSHVSGTLLTDGSGVSELVAATAHCSAPIAMLQHLIDSVHVAAACPW